MGRCDTERCYGDIWMLIAISELYFAKIYIITSINNARYCGVIKPKTIKRSFYLGAHLDSLYFIPLSERKGIYSDCI
jgi:hypothetical protein